MTKRPVMAMVFSGGLIILIAFAFFGLYAQFALDYTLENLRETLEAVQENDYSDLRSRAYHSNLENLAVEEMAQKDADLQSVMLLELAARSVRDAVDQFGSARAGLYLTEILREKSLQRSAFLRMTDAFFHYLKTFVRSAMNLWRYVWNRVRGARQTPQLETAGALILSEAEKMEKSWKLAEAEKYYREFLDRYQSRPERGFVQLSLVHLLIKMRRLDEAVSVLREVRKSFPGTREEALAVTLEQRVLSIQRRLARLSELESWIKRQPERLFSEEGGLELALSYLATYQLDRAISVLEKLSEAKDPRIRNKALFYRGWVAKWRGDPDQGRKLFEMLEKEPQAGETLTHLTSANLADIAYQKKEYKQAIERYENISAKAVSETWKALSELEQSNIYLVGLKNTEVARQHLQRLETLIDSAPATGREILRTRLREALDTGLRDEAFYELRDGKVDSALNKFGQYTAKFSRDGRAYSAVGSIYLLKGRLPEALDEAEKGFSLTRDEYTATVLGYVYEKMKKYDEAGKYYWIGTTIKSTYLPARFNLSWVYLMTRHFQEADHLLASLERDAPRFSIGVRAKIFNNRGCALWGLGKRGEAVIRFQEALKTSPDFSEAKNNLMLAVGEKPVPAGI